MTKKIVAMFNNNGGYATKKVGALLGVLATCVMVIGLYVYRGGSMQLTSSAFNNGQAIPTEYTCDGSNWSPPLSWTGVPKETKSLVLLCEDPDALAVAGKTWVHWLVINIDPSVSSVPAGYTVGKLMPQAVEGMTDFGTIGYGGPCPPSGQHTYRFTLYALDMKLSFVEGVSRRLIEFSMKGHVLAQAELSGSYARNAA